MPRLASSCTLVAVLGLVASSGCARAETAQDKQLAEMREQMSRIQQENDRFDQRLGALEIAQADDKQPPIDNPAPKKSTGGAPPGRTVQLGADDSRESDDPNDTTNVRPQIQVSGPAGARTARVNMPSTPDTPSRSSATDPEAKRTYDRGLAEVQGKQLDRGLETLASFLVKWPDHPYAANAMYWRGEAYYAKGDYPKAAEQFEAVLTRFAGGSKAADALLKMGMCHDKLGAPARAQEYWDRLRTEYPRSDAAKRIPVAPKDDRKGPR
jgi:tol-pal system protein YbgF